CRPRPPRPLPPFPTRRSSDLFRDRLTLRGLESLHVALRPGSKARGAITVMAPAVPSPSPAILDTERRALELRPRAHADGTDAGWRDALRTRTEHDGTGIPRRTGEDLAATVALLRRASLFARCTLAELEALATTAYPVSFEPGEQLCVEGADALE